MWWANPVPLLCLLIMLIFDRDTKTHSAVSLVFPPPPSTRCSHMSLNRVYCHQHWQHGRGCFLLRSTARQEAWSKVSTQRLFRLQQKPFLWNLILKLKSISVLKLLPSAAASGLQHRWESCCGQLSGGPLSFESATANLEGCVIPVGLCW